MSVHHKRAKWDNQAKKARDRIAALLPAPCVECGKPVMEPMKWDVGHRVPLSLGGSVLDYGPAHRSCNRRNGGRLGAAKTNKRDPRNVPTDGARRPQW